MKSAAVKAAAGVAVVVVAGVGVAGLASKPSMGPAGPDYCLAPGSQATRIHQYVVDGYKDPEDTSRSLQQAIDAAAKSGGAVVQLPEGTFMLAEPLLVKSNVALRGQGAGTILKAGPGFLSSEGPFGGHPLITTNGANNVTIAGLTADHSGDQLDGNTRGRLSEYLVDVRHSRNALVEGIRTQNPFTYSIAVVASSDFCVRNNQTVADSSGSYDQLDGIHITDSHGGVVEGNTVDQGQGADGDDGLVAQTIGAEVFDVVYRNNNVRGGPHGSGLQLAVGKHSIRNITVENNTFRNSPNGIQTGYYDGFAAVRDIHVVGNSFAEMPGPWLTFHGELQNINVADNLYCHTGSLRLGAGPGTKAVNNKEAC